jgi:hypothetical protein
MSKKYSFLLILAIVSATWAAAQNPRNTSFKLKKKSTVKVQDITEDWLPSLQNLEMPNPVPGTIKHRVKEAKELNMQKYSQKSPEQLKEAPRSSGMTPVMLRNFQGNAYNFRAPNDNDMAISNAGYIVSVINSTILFRHADINIDSIIKVVSLEAFSASLSISGSKFDPKVVYDPIEDKFIMVFLNGFTDSTNFIIVAFSETGNPHDNWHLYQLPGNPYNNSLWSDYPIIAITEKEFFLTLNLLNNNMSWQEGFVESIIWQIRKSDGYEGLPLTNVLHNNIAYGGTPVRNLCPIQGGAYPTGPDIYLLSNKNFSAESDSIFLIHLPDTIGGSNNTPTLQLLQSANKYFMAPYARQPNGHAFDTNDSRVLGGYIENGKIHFVQNCMDTATGFAGFFHGIVTDLSGNPQVSGKIIGDTILDLGYPNISYSGTSTQDDRAIISFNHSASSVFPGFSAIEYDNGTYTSIVSLKEGTRFINVLADNTERWGDYSGSQRKYNEPGIVWTAGTFGTLSNRYGTWIAELASNQFSGTVKRSLSGIDSKIYPNPASDAITIDFEMQSESFCKFQLFDINGKLVKLLLTEKVKKGRNQFSFSLQHLEPGTYFLSISDNKEVLLNKKLIKF